MRLRGHYSIHAGHTNNKYYNIPDGERQEPYGSGTTMQHIVIHVVLMTVLLLRKSFITVLGTELRRYGRACLDLMYAAHNRYQVGSVR